jgi:Na+-translocating ferredoxin:NAD+ oxidoreductase subunit G
VKENSLKKFIFFAFLAVLLPSGISARVILNQAEALERTFPGTQLERKTIFLSNAQKVLIQRSAGARLESQVVTYYVARSSTGLQGVAFFDKRIVRTMEATFMTVVNAGGDIRLVEVLSFAEPEDYLPRERWLRLYEGMVLDDRLRLRREIPNVTGASLTCQSINDSVRLMLAVYQTAIKGTR